MNAKIPPTKSRLLPAFLFHRAGSWTGFHRVRVLNATLYCTFSQTKSILQGRQSMLSGMRHLEGLRADVYCNKQTVEKMRMPCLTDISREERSRVTDSFESLALNPVLVSFRWVCLAMSKLDLSSSDVRCFTELWWKTDCTTPIATYRLFKTRVRRPWHPSS